MTRDEKRIALEKSLCFQTFFETACTEGARDAAVWLENDEITTYSFDDLSRKVAQAAARIHQAGVSAPGGWVGLAMDTAPDWPVMFWALLKAGRKPILIDPGLEDAPVMHLLKQGDAKALVSRRAKNLPGVTVFAPETLLSGEAAPFAGAWADEVALCTSGTTATSRVFVYNGRSLALQVLSIMKEQLEHPIVKESNGPLRTLCFLPLNHIFGLVTNMTWTFLMGFPQVYLKDRAPQTILSTCQKCKVELIMAVPLLVNSLSVTVKKRLAKEKAYRRALVHAMMGISIFAQRISPMMGLSVGKKLFHSINKNLFGDSLRLIIAGGSHTPEEHLRTMHALGYAVIIGFGMTEVGVTSVESKMILKNRLTGSVGWPLSISEYKIRPDGKDENHGELLIRTEARHIARLVDGQVLPPAVDEEGYYETGDVVRIGKKGRMYVEGRTKDVIIGESGENIYPDELEDVFSGIDGVDQLCVLGVKPEGSDYERIALVLNVGSHYGDEKFLLDLSRRVQQKNKQMPPMRRVQLVYATPEALPLVSGIKVKRIQLREMLLKHKVAYRALTAQGAGEAVAPQRQEDLPQPDTMAVDLKMEEIRDKVRHAFAEVLEMDIANIGDDAHFIDELGGDSLQSLGVSLKVEELFSVMIPQEQYASCTSVSDLSAVIYQLLQGDAPYNAEVAREEGKELKPITRFEDTPEFAAFQLRLKSMEGQKNPYFVCHESPLMDTSLMDGREVLNFGSYNYVGMSGRKETMEAAKAAIDKYGTSASGSRLLAGEKSLYQELEKEIASWKHSESALVLVGGHSTNVTIVGNFCGRDDLIVYDAISHNSIQEGCRLSGATSKPFPHNDAEALEGILRAQRDKFAKVLIIVEGAYSMDGDIAPIPAFVALKKKYGCFLLVDEAHSACVIGRTGGGVDEYFGLAHDDIDIKMGTLSKGLGTCGGYLAGRTVLIEYLRYNLPGFVFSVGISPPLAAATLAAIRQLRENPQIIADLQRNIRVFVEGAHRRNLNTCLAGETAVIPVMVGQDEDAFMLSTALGEKGVFVPPAVYPAVPKNKARLRFCVISEHKPEQIEHALDVLVETAAEMQISLPESVGGTRPPYKTPLTPFQA